MAYRISTIATAAEESAPGGPEDSSMELLPEELEARLLQVKIHALRIYRRCKAVPFQDLEGSGFLGLAQAASHYNPEAGVAFKTFADPRIRGAMIDSLRRCPLVPIPYRKGYPKGPVKDLDERWPDTRAAVERFASGAEVVRQALDKLTPRERIVTVLLMGGYTQAEVGEVIGTREARVSQLLTRIRVKLEYLRPCKKGRAMAAGVGALV